MNRISTSDADFLSGPNPANTRPPARVIAVNRFYWPDQAATSQLLSDLTGHLAARGWAVSVIASRTRYDGVDGHLAPREERDGIRISRVWTSRVRRDSLAGRALDYLTFHISAGSTLLAQVRRGDVILVTTDPPLFMVVAAMIARLKGARLVTWNHDVFPEVAAALGVSSAGGKIGRVLGWLRNLALRRASVNVVLSDAMARHLRKATGRADSLRVIPNWSYSKIQPVPHADNKLRRAWGLGNTFVIGYAGNLGRAHMPDKVAELVRCTRHIPGLVWLFIGGGVGTDRIRRMVAETGATNVQLRPYLPRADLVYSLSVPDLHLVSLEPNCEGLIVPSKIAGILAAGRPLLYLGHPASAIGREIDARGVGICLDPTAPESWCAHIAALRRDQDRLREMARQARLQSEIQPPEHALLDWETTLAKAAHDVRPAQQ